jgi:hypothetical protein
MGANNAGDGIPVCDAKTKEAKLLGSQNQLLGF